MLDLTSKLLAPGDAKSAALDPAQFSWTRIRDLRDPAFEVAYEVLWNEFGAACEMESREVLAGRFDLGPAMQYEMVLVKEGERIAAVRDHTAIWADGEVVVHLSHVLVMEPWRRSGLAGWMRAVPILVASEVATLHGVPNAPITLIGEMEYDDGSDPKRSIRLKAYERAGYWKVDPAVARYHQPDFRAPEVIDASGGPCPLAFQLIVREVGAEGAHALSSERVQRWVQALYAMYGAQFRACDMQHPLLNLDHYAAVQTDIPLIPPTRA